MPGENIYSWSTTAANNATADTSINWAEGQPRASVNNSSRSELAAHAKYRNLRNGSITTTGTANAQAFVSPIVFSGSVPTGLRALLKIGAALTNTGATTLNMDAIGAVAIKYPDGSELGAGALVAGSYADVLYDGTNWVLLGMSTPSGLVLIDQQTASNVNFLAFTTGIDSTFDQYLFVLAGMQPTITNPLVVRVSTNGGVSYDASASYWWGLHHTSSTSLAISGDYGSVISSLATYFQLGLGQGTTAPEALDGEFRLFRPSNTSTYKQATWHVSTMNIAVGAGAVNTTGGGSFVLTPAAVNAVQFFYANAGNISTGTISLYGLRK